MVKFDFLSFRKFIFVIDRLRQLIYNVTHLRKSEGPEGLGFQLFRKYLRGIHT